MRASTTLPMKAKSRKQRELETATAAMGCIVCHNEGVNSPAELHHLRSGVGMGQRSNRIIGLCPAHHRTAGRGVSFHSGKMTWQRNHGTEEELWAQTQELLRAQTSA